MIKITISERDSGQRLDKYLRKYLEKSTSGFLYKMLRKKNITLNGGKAAGSEMLRPSDEITLFLSDETIRKFGGTDRHYRPYEKAYETYGELEIVFENEHVLVANKPAGILTQKASPEDLSLNEWLIGYLLEKGKISEEELHAFKPSVCNRLDRNTSGLILCGKTLAGSQKISSLLKNRSLRKFYCLYVKGRVTESSQIEGYLKKKEEINKVEICEDAETAEASYIKTAYKPLKNYRDITMLEAELITGKPHQIRIHLASIGHPVLGDYKYGHFEFNDRYKKKYGIDKQILHAYRLEFPEMEEKWADMSKLVLNAKLPEIFRILDEGEK